jgi:hypothetical protein
MDTNMLVIPFVVNQVDMLRAHLAHCWIDTYARKMVSRLCCQV